MLRRITNMPAGTIGFEAVRGGRLGGSGRTGPAYEIASEELVRLLYLLERPYWAGTPSIDAYAMPCGTSCAQTDSAATSSYRSHSDL
jgi:hypothetical protein